MTLGNLFELVHVFQDRVVKGSINLFSVVFLDLIEAQKGLFRLELSLKRVEEDLLLSYLRLSLLETVLEAFKAALSVKFPLSQILTRLRLLY